MTETPKPRLVATMPTADAAAAGPVRRSRGDGRNRVNRWINSIKSYVTNGLQNDGNPATAQFRGLIPHKSSDKVIVHSASQYEVSSHVEVDGIEYPIGDKSITQKQLLRVWDSTPVDTIDLTTYVIDKTTGLRKQINGVDIKGTNVKVLKMSAQTLLRKGKPFSHEPKVKREASKSKRIKFDRYDPILQIQTPTAFPSKEAAINFLITLFDPPTF